MKSLVMNFLKKVINVLSYLMKTLTMSLLKRPRYFLFVVKAVSRYKCFSTVYLSMHKRNLINGALL